jgi:nucleoid-associated protein YgaU
MDEAPRALIVGSPEDATINDAKSYERSIAHVQAVETPALRPHRSGDVVSAHWTRESPADDALRASMGATPNTPPGIAAAVAPPPIWPNDNTDEPRSHIVVDGDSLAKLAGRYLNDPRRAAEIYARNQHILSNPDLLPIGIELVIPSHTGSAEDARSAPQSFMPRAVAVHARPTGGLVPVRPVPTASSVLPRAYLSWPRPAAE